MNAKIGVCQRRCPHNEEPPRNEAALHYGERTLSKGRPSPHVITSTQAGRNCSRFSIPSGTLAAATGSNHSLYHRSLWSRRILCRKSRPENNRIGAEITKNLWKQPKKVSQGCSYAGGHWFESSSLHQKLKSAVLGLTHPMPYKGSTYQHRQDFPDVVFACIFTSFQGGPRENFSPECFEDITRIGSALLSEKADYPCGKPIALLAPP